MTNYKITPEQVDIMGATNRLMMVAVMLADTNPELAKQVQDDVLCIRVNMPELRVIREDVSGGWIEE